MAKGYNSGYIAVNDPTAFNAYAKTDRAILRVPGSFLGMQGSQSEMPAGDTRARPVVIEVPGFGATTTADGDPGDHMFAKIGRRAANSDFILVKGT